MSQMKIGRWTLSQPDHGNPFSGTKQDFTKIDSASSVSDSQTRNSWCFMLNSLVEAGEHWRYSITDTTLRSQDPQQQALVRDCCDTLNAALNKLPVFVGTVRRRTDLPDHINVRYRTGSINTEAERRQDLHPRQLSSHQSICCVRGASIGIDSSSIYIGTIGSAHSRKYPVTTSSIIKYNCQ